MKTLTNHLLRFGAIVTTIIMLAGASRVGAQGTAFTYQGVLNVNGSPANGAYDFEFSLYDNSNATILQAVTGTLAVPVTNGLFTTTIDFGQNVFTGLSNWLQISVRSNNTGSYSNLAPVQFLTPTPTAIFANNASNLLGTLPVAKLSGQVANNQIQNSSLTVTAGTGLSGGGLVLLGGSITLTNAGVLSVTGTNDLTATNTAGAVKIVDNGTNSAVASTLVKRDSTGSFQANNLTVQGILTLGTEGSPHPTVELYAGDLFIASDANSDFFAGEDAGDTTPSTASSYNTGLGNEALLNLRGGSYNTAVGWATIAYNFYGSSNTAVGYQALGQLGIVGQVGGSNNIAIGYNAGYNLYGIESNDIYIGHVGNTGESNTIRIGTPGFQANTYLTGVINGNGAGLTNTTTAANYVFAYDTTTQTISSNNVAQLVSFAANGQINGWSHSAGSAPFICTQAGLYLVQYTAEAESTASGAITVSLRATVDSTTAEITGSQASVTFGTASEPAPVSKSFLASFNSGDVMYFEVYGSSTSAALVTGNGSGTTKPSISCTIVRIQ